ncbi:MAG: hypothetical protein OXC17_14650 [Aestuariivita sp.]|nr:hypothetical protein [Aestuariivita sp.]
MYKDFRPVLSKRQINENQVIGGANLKVRLSKGGTAIFGLVPGLKRSNGQFAKAIKVSKKG